MIGVMYVFYLPRGMVQLIFSFQYARIHDIIARKRPRMIAADLSQVQRAPESWRPCIPFLVGRQCLQGARRRWSPVMQALPSIRTKRSNFCRTYGPESETYCLLPQSLSLHPRPVLVEKPAHGQEACVLCSHHTRHGCRPVITTYNACRRTNGQSAFSL